ncbi:type I pullulanase [Longirhabdus pacifica]|uniref:type I pullulanase n=1 Tax=Longirhabdus pacifica TaxID=2305227 RepID=UPI0013E8F468|nr:type I pullulanase [Longirhabdus pacifica]
MNNDINFPTYGSVDLGNVYAATYTTFKVWSPTAKQVMLIFYHSWNDKLEHKQIEMTKSDGGTWTTTVKGDLHGVIYNYKVYRSGEWEEVVDPYVRAVTVNGHRGVVIDVNKTNPKHWYKQYKTNFSHPVDAVFYELHVRDFSIDHRSPFQYKGKYLAFTETNTTLHDGVKIGLDHLAELGVTHIQLLPVFDYESVDESNLHIPQYNWGYDPKHLNVPEGSYASDPYDPMIRIKEWKKAIQILHENGFKVVMDVVYNHLFSVHDSNLHQLAPGYFFRYNQDGALMNNTGVGNDTASERDMVRKWIVDSVCYWASEYKIDGFRFDLMSIHDVETMNDIREQLDKIDPSIIMIGEGWNINTVLPSEDIANQHNAHRMPRIAQFNDFTRDGLKGSVFQPEVRGWINGDYAQQNKVKGSVVGGVKWSDDIGHFAKEPDQCVNYVECHDNHTLWDKLSFTQPHDDEHTKIKMHKLAMAFLLTSQGIPFLHAGQEFLRTKKGVANSYRSGDDINQLDWERKRKYIDVFQYTKGLITLRAAHSSFRIQHAADIRKHLLFLDSDSSMIAYHISHDERDIWKHIVVAHNADRQGKALHLPFHSEWNIVVNEQHAGTDILSRFHGNHVIVPSLSTMVMYKS